MFARAMLCFLVIAPSIASAQPLQPLVVDPGPSAPAIVEAPPVQPPGTDPLETRPLGRWWFDTSVEFAWMSTQDNPKVVRIHSPDFFGNRIPAIRIDMCRSQTPAFGAGLQFHLGRWFDDNQMFGLEAGGFILPGAAQTFQAKAPHTLVLFPAGTDQSAPLLLRFPQQFGNLSTTFPATESTSFTTVDLDVRAGLLVTEQARLDFLAGYRFAYLEDELYFGDLPTGGHDDYRSNRMTVENTFHGAQVGLGAHYRTTRWYTDGFFKLALGGVTTKSAASGAFLYPDQPVRFQSDSHAAFMPTLNLRVGYRLSERASVFAGYNFLYLSRASRLGDAFTPGSGSLSNSEFWIQSLSLGLDCRF